jgi:hypothetical protein
MEFQIVEGEIVATAGSSRELVQLWALLKPIELTEKDRPLVTWLLSQGVPTLDAFEDLLLRVRKHTVATYLQAEHAQRSSAPGQKLVVDWTQTRPR